MDAPATLPDLTFQGLYRIDEAGGDDIFIASYPKSGVTWLQHLTACLFFGFDGTRVPDRVVQNLVPDMHNEKYFIRIPSFPAVLKWHGLPDPKMRRVVHLVRDGRDAAVSYHRMLRSLEMEGSIDQIVAGDVWPGGWGDHTEAWLNNPHGAEILRIRYEDLLETPLETLRGYVEFCGHEVADSNIRRAIEGCSFENMRRKEESFGWGLAHQHVRGNSIAVGRSGQFRSEMPEGAQAAFERRYRRQLDAFGYN